MEHLGARPGVAEAERRAEVAVLRWVYGNLVYGPVEDFVEAQKRVRCGKERDVGVMECYDEIAFAWRQLQAFQDKCSRLEELRRGARVRRWGGGKAGWLIG